MYDRKRKTRCFSKKFRKIYCKAGKKLAIITLKNPSEVLDITATMAAAAASRNPKAALDSLPEVINFYHTGKGLYFSETVQYKLYKRIDYTHQHH